MKPLAKAAVKQLVLRRTLCMLIVWLSTWTKHGGLGFACGETIWQSSS